MLPELKTERLRIFPAPPELLRRSARSGDLAGLLGLTSLPLSPKERKLRRSVCRYKYRLCRKHPTDYLCCTAWPIVLRAENLLVGEIGFKGPPNTEGELDLGYSIRLHFRNRGLMTEALKAFCPFAFTLFRPRAVTATTHADNLPSQRVLLKCGFVRAGYWRGMILWEKHNNLVC